MFAFLIPHLICKQRVNSLPQGRFCQMQTYEMAHPNENIKRPYVHTNIQINQLAQSQKELEAKTFTKCKGAKGLQILYECEEESEEG